MNKNEADAVVRKLALDFICRLPYKGAPHTCALASPAEPTQTSDRGWGRVAASVVFGFFTLFRTCAVTVLTPGPICAQTTSPSLGAWLSQADRLQRSKDYAGAEKVYRQALIASPENPDILKALGVVCQKQLKYAESIEVFQEILKRAPHYPGVNLLLGISYYSENEFDKAVDAEKQELVGDPTNRQARYYLALALNALDRRAEAIEQLERLRADHPQDPALLYQLALYYKSAAKQLGQQLTRVSPDSVWTHALQGEILADAQRHQEAILEFKEVLRKNPDFPGMHFALGQVYWLEKNHEDAQRELQAALVEDPQQPLANYYLGDILTSRKEFQEAVPHLRLAISVYPGLTQAYFLLGKCYAGAGNLQGALETFKKALEQDPNYKEVHYQLSELYARLGDKDSSQAELRIFQKLTKEGQEMDKALLQENSQKQSEAAVQK
jgi:tetratricopeptide (TPR) repeat protein